MRLRPAVVCPASEPEIEDPFAVGVAFSSFAWALQFVVTPGCERVLAEHVIGAMRLAPTERAMVEGSVVRDV
jgi:hypothetical protein